MIFIAIILHIISRYIPSWITRKSIEELRTQHKWRQLLFEMLGTAMDFFLAFLILSSVLLTNKVTYLPNENAIYGIECSEDVKGMGFRDGDKIRTINGKNIERFSDILITILKENGQGPVKVVVLRDNSELVLSLKTSDKINLIESKKYDHFKPRLEPNNLESNDIKELIVKEHRQEIGDVFNAYRIIVKQLSIVFNPLSQNTKQVGFFRADTIKGLLFILASSFILIGFVNLLPIPGLDFGNLIIALIDKVRKRKFNRGLLKTIRIICMSVILIVFIIIFFINS